MNIKLIFRSPIYIARTVAFFLCLGVTALLWDAWWHIAVGRDTFWEAPHLLLYPSVMVALLTSLLGWWATKETVWKKLAIAALLIPLSAPFDNAWHNFFGIENLNTILIIWSPPHLFLFGALIASMILVLPLIKQDRRAMYFLGDYLFAALLAISIGIAVPFYPFGPYHIFGFFGAGIIGAIIIGYLFLGSRWNRPFGASSVALFFLAIYFLQDTTSYSPWVKVAHFPHIPQFIFFASVFLPALLIDLKQKISWIFGMGLGVLYGATFYMFTSRFLPLEFQYPAADILVAVFTSAIGGGIAGFLVHFLLKRHSGIVFHRI